MSDFLASFVTRDGLVKRLELLEIEETEAALARFAELSGARPDHAG